MIYKFRAECRNDVNKLISLFSKKDIIKYKIISDSDGLPDVDVEIELNNIEFELFRDKMKSIDESHVMLETLAEIKDYKRKSNVNELVYRPIVQGNKKSLSAFDDFIKECEKILSKAGDNNHNKAEALNTICNRVVQYNDISKTEIFIDHISSKFPVKKMVLTQIIKSLQKQNKEENEPPAPTIIPEVTQLENFLSDHYEVRYNILSNLFEYREKDKGKFTELNEYNVLRRFRKLRYDTTRQKLIEVMKSDFTPQFNPIYEYFKNSQWDGEDHIEKLCGYVHVTEKDRERFNRHFRKMFVRAIASAMGVTYNKRAMVFIGGQDAGKTYFTRWLCPKQLQEYCTENIDFSTKDGLISLANNFWILLDEMANMPRNDINQVKSIMSRDKIKARLPYDRRDTLMQRRCTFIGSTNDKEFLTDPTGNVRWICFLLVGKGLDWSYEKEVDIDQVWAQAYFLFKNGYKYLLTKEELQENEFANIEFMKNTVEIELLQKHYSRAKKGEPGAVFMTTSEILDDMLSKMTGSRLNINLINLGKALSVLKFQKDSIYKKDDKTSIKGYFLKCKN